MKKVLSVLFIIFLQQLNAQLTFPSITYTVNTAARGLVTADFNNDNKLDLMTSDDGGPSYLLLGNGIGGFGSQIAAIQGYYNSASFLITGDFNKDGFADVGGIVSWSRNVNVFYGNGTGSFPVKDSFLVDSLPVQFITADLNSDGFLDIATANSTWKSISILFNNGAGSFNPAVTLSLTNKPSSITSGDFNGDGYIDLAANIPGSIAVLFGNTTGNFTTPTYFSGIAGGSFSISSKDFNSDGFDDIVTADVYATNLSVFLGSGTGFSPVTTFPSGNSPYSIICEDLNADGFFDIATSNHNGNDVSILTGTGTGTFNGPSNYAVWVGPWTIVSGDFNRDGRFDLATSDYQGGSISVILCSVSDALMGSVFTDNNSNCVKDAGDQNLVNIPIKLFDTNNTLLQQTYPSSNGDYFFVAPTGPYKVLIDTSSLPITVQCLFPGLDSNVTITGIDSNINFSFICNSGFDLGIKSVFNAGQVFPGQNHTLGFVIGDMTQEYNLNCLSGISGQVQITVNGPVSYVSAAPGSLTPTITGNVYTYSIADFGLVNNKNDFNLIFLTDNSAQLGDTICVDVTVSPTALDIYPTNNYHHYCYIIGNSHDPNLKEVYPVDVQPGFLDWFTYTVHFQNTGTAAAINIRLTDILDSSLDVSTFQMINYSHANITTLNGNFLNVRFANINLADSTSNFAGSQGFIQYRVKPKANLTAGTQIKNTANIYFDYNPAVVTNTTINHVLYPAGIKEELDGSLFGVYPNPANEILNLQSKIKNVEFKVFDVIGNQVRSGTINDLPSKTSIAISDLQNGIYFITFRDAQQKYFTTQKIVKQN